MVVQLLQTGGILICGDGVQLVVLFDETVPDHDIFVHLTEVLIDERVEVAELFELLEVSL